MRTWIALGLLTAMAFAGCSSGGGEGGQRLQVDEDTGGIRGLVVDQSIVPVGGATASLTGGPDAGKSVVTGPDGLFNFTGLQPGDYIVSVGKAGFKASQSSTTVVAGDAQPPIIKLQLERIATAEPYLDHFKLDGYYSCTFALFFITDSCEFVYRTAWDGVNATGIEPPTPRTIQNARNTQYIDIPQDTFTIVQEGFWDEQAVPVFWIMIDETPIDNSCDCSDTYGNRIGSMPLLSRLERYDALGADNKNFTADYSDPIGTFPVGKTVASRGFIPFQEAPLLDGTDPNRWQATAVNFQFVVMTSLFHNYVPDPAWTFETRENFPLG
ncbi:MAG: carboxypeptidase-like regulatory domain-containing protein [Candidatus Thermoplasmatota archaeon]